MSAEPKPAAPGAEGKKVAAKASKSASSAGVAPKQEAPQAKAQSKASGTPPPMEAAPAGDSGMTMRGLIGGPSSSNGPASELPGSNKSQQQQQQQQPAAKVPAWKLALKASAAASKTAAAATGGGGGGSSTGGGAAAASAAASTADGTAGAASGGAPAPKAIPAWKLKNMQAQQAAAAITPAAAAAPQENGDSAGAAINLPGMNNTSSSSGGGYGSSGAGNASEGELFSEDDDSVGMRGDSASPSRTTTPVDFGAAAKSDGGPSGSSRSGSGNGSSSPYLREKPSLRKAARMAMMLNRYAPSGAESAAGPSEPKNGNSQPAWKLANQNAALNRSARLQGGGNQGSGSSSAQGMASPPPPAPAPTPIPSGGNSRSETPRYSDHTHGTGTNGTYTANTSAFNSRPGTDMSGTSGTNTYYDGDSPTSRPGTGMSGRYDSSRPGTEMSGAYYTSDDDDQGGGYPGGHDGRRSASFGRHSSAASDTDYESGGMTDILSGGEESDANHDRFSDDNNNLTHASGSSGGQGSNANTLFGMNIKKTLSRPADRVEQAERKAERMDYRPSGDRQPSSDSAYFSSGNDNHGNVSDPSRSKPSGPSKQLTTLEKIMGRANMNVAEAKNSGNSEGARPGSKSSQQQQQAMASSSQWGDSSGGTDEEARMAAVAAAVHGGGNAGGRYSNNNVNSRDAGGGGDNSEKNRTPAEHRASAARGQDLIARLMGKKTAAAGEVLSGDFPAAPKDSNKQDEGEESSANLDQPEVAEAKLSVKDLAASKFGGGVTSPNVPAAKEVPAWKKANQAAAQDAKQKADQWLLENQGIAPPAPAAAAAATAPSSQGAGAASATAGAAASSSAAPVSGLPLYPSSSSVLATSFSATATSAVASVRRDMDRLATQRTAAGLKPEKHGLVDLLMLKSTPQPPSLSSSSFSPFSSSSSSSTYGAHGQQQQQQQQPREFVYNPTPMRDRPINQNNQNVGNMFGAGGGRGYSSSAATTAGAGGRHDQQQDDEPDVERRFVSVSNGSIYVASYFTLLDTGGFVECSNLKRSATSEKVADLLKCAVEVEECAESGCGFQLRIARALHAPSQRLHGGSGGGRGLHNGSSDAILLRPSRLAEFMEWASVAQQVVDQASVAAELLKQMPSAIQQRKDSKGRVFKLPGQQQQQGGGAYGSGDGGDYEKDMRYTNTKRDLWRLEQKQQQAQQAAIAQALEQQASLGGVVASGVQESNKMMQALYDVTNRNRAPPRYADNHAQQQQQPPRVPFTFPQSNANADGDGEGSSRTQDDELMEKLLRLRTTPLTLPPPPAPDPETGKAQLNINSVLAATRGSRMAPSPVNGAIFLRNFEHKDVHNYTAGLTWLSDYRAIQAELDDMEFSTDRTLGYLAQHKHKFYTMGNPAASTSASPSGGGAGATGYGNGHRSNPSLYSGTDPLQTRTSGPPKGGVAAHAPSLLSRPSATVPLLANIDSKQFRFEVAAGRI